MVFHVKDITKLFGISLICSCAVLVCHMFLNFNLDLQMMKDTIHNPQLLPLYDALVMSGNVISGISGGCLLLTSVVMLFFFIRNFIDTHKQEMGILKAIGYSRFQIVKGFWVFGLSVLIGSLCGFFAAYLIMPKFYEMQNKDLLLPEIPIHFHLELLISFVILPTIVFALLSILYGYYKLHTPVLDLLKDRVKTKSHKYKKDKGLSFMQELQKSTIHTHRSLTFFIMFASFCYSSMMQMSSSVKDLASPMMSFVIVFICLILAVTTLFLAITSLLHQNIKNIAMMKVFGYSSKECGKAILNGYRPMVYLGFLIGTLYQYGILKFMVTIVFADIDTIPVYQFDWGIFFLVLLSFIVLYEGIMRYYTWNMKKISLKEVMLES